MMNLPFSRNTTLQALLWLAALALLTGIAFVTRYYTPIDETRYVSVAWEMWLRGDFLVPYKNGETYSHKPPLMFWLFHAGWALFGVNDWWPRLVSPLFSLGSLFLTWRLARVLWPERPAASALAPLVVLGSLLWAVFSAAAMFDIILAFIVLLGVNGLVHAWRHGGRAGWVVFGIAIGLGILEKGPVALLHLLPLAVLAPWWMRQQRPAWKRWYLGVAGSFLLGAAIALAWAIPAAISGGEAYRNAILWGQTANRMVDSFAHKRPLWWYLPLLPVLLFPWLMWPAAWRAWRSLTQAGENSGVRLCLAWLVPVFVFFSLISGKQVHYLLPLFPPFALLTAYALSSREAGTRRLDGLLPGLLLVLSGALVLALPSVTRHYHLPEWMDGISWLPGAALVGLGLALVLLRYANLMAETLKYMLVSIAVVTAISLGIIKHISPAYDVRPMAAQIQKLQAQGVAIAHVGNYHAQYQFAGRLTQPLEIIRQGELADWFARHPEGRAVAYFRDWADLDGVPVVFRQHYRGEVAAIISHATLDYLRAPTRDTEKEVAE